MVFAGGLCLFCYLACCVRKGQCRLINWWSSWWWEVNDWICELCNFVALVMKLGFTMLEKITRIWTSGLISLSGKLANFPLIHWTSYFPFAVMVYHLPTVKYLDLHPKTVLSDDVLPKPNVKVVFLCYNETRGFHIFRMPLASPETLESLVNLLIVALTFWLNMQLIIPFFMCFCIEIIHLNLIKSFPTL